MRNDFKCLAKGSHTYVLVETFVFTLQTSDFAEVGMRMPFVHLVASYALPVSACHVAGAESFGC